MLPTKPISFHSTENSTRESTPPVTQGKIASFWNAVRNLGGKWHSDGDPLGERWPPWILGLFLAVGIILTYSNSLHGPFHYDDFMDIRDNPTIRHIWPVRDVFYISGSGFMTRPIVNLTFAINYATGGLNPFHYHLTNLCIHICASLALLGVVRRTLSLPTFKGQFWGHISTLSLVSAALWALHPLLTESVSYITQRYESLMGLFVLLTFYCVLRMVDSPAPSKWGVLASGSCLLALGSKEVAVSVPILIFLFDRIFMAGSFRRAWEERRILYMGLLAAWAIFAFIQVHPVERTFAGFGLTLPWWRYALNQPNVVLHYLHLAIWPYPLNFDYLWRVANTWNQLVPGIVVISILLILTLWAFFRKPYVAFLAIFFFFILAPTSSVMPILDLAVEHRMYLPLISVVLIVVFSIYHIVLISNKNHRINSALSRGIAVLLFSATLAALGALTYLRNEDYQNSIDIWRDAVAKAPDNPRAHHNYAFNLAEAGYVDQALHEYQIAISQAPNMPLFHGNYGELLGKLGRYQEGLVELRMAVRLDPKNYKYYYTLGTLLLRKGSLDNAIICLDEAIQINPKAGVPYAGLASAFLTKNQLGKALEQIHKAISLEPYIPGFHYQLGVILLRLGDLPEARRSFRDAIYLDGNSGTMTSDVGWAFHEHGMDQEGLINLRLALSLKPSHTRSQVRLAWILATSSDDSLRNGSEAFALVQNILRSQSSPSPEMLDLLAVSLAELGHFPEARAALQVALAQSKDRKEAWASDMEKRLILFQKNRPYRDTPKN